MIGWQWVLNGGWICVDDSDFHLIKPAVILVCVPCVTSDMSCRGQRSFQLNSSASLWCFETCQVASPSAAVGISQLPPQPPRVIAASSRRRGSWEDAQFAHLRTAPTTGGNCQGYFFRTGCRLPSVAGRAWICATVQTCLDDGFSV